VKVFTYQHDYPNCRNEILRQVWLWQQSWQARGWEPRVLSEADARVDSDYAALSAAASKYPTLNNPAYERQCYLRHLAFRAAHAEFISDYDVLNVSYAPSEYHRSLSYGGKIVSLDVGGNVSVACFSPGGRDTFINLLLDEGAVLSTGGYTYPGKPTHYSDMTVFMSMAGKERVAVSHDLSDVIDEVQKGNPSALRLNPPLVHFNTDSIISLGVGPESKSSVMSDYLHRRRQFKQYPR
jgi:hypothetical protein